MHTDRIFLRDQVLLLMLAGQKRTEDACYVKREKFKGDAQEANPEREEIYDFAAHYHFSSEDLATWPGKILILESDQDKAYSPAIRAETRAVYPQARVYTFHNAGHTGIMIDPDEFINAIREFLAES